MNHSTTATEWPQGEHVAYVDERYMYTDDNGIDHYAPPRDVMCGSWNNGRILCDTCQRLYEREYPQGWAYYPGDVCKHGKYTGGCGIDWICQYCEMGE